MTDDALRAGAAKTVISPPVGVDLCGFGGRPGPSSSVHDDLRGCALAVSDGSQTVLWITADLIGLRHDEVAGIRQRIEAATGVPATSIMIGCSHTHSGPATRCIDSLGDHDHAYLSWLYERLGSVGVSAVEALRPAVVGCARVPLTIGVNRRENRKGHIVLGENPTGPTAPYADVLYVDDLDGASIARMFCHPAHAVTLGGENVAISGDWPGFAQREVEARYGDECVALFLQGCCGDINCGERGTFADAERQGRRMAQAVVDGDAGATRLTRASVRACSLPLELPPCPPPDVRVAAAQLAEAEKQAAAPGATDSYGHRKMNIGAVPWARRVLELAEGGESTPIPFEVQALSVGGFATVGLPGEVFVQYALQIDRGSPFDVTAAPAYTNGNVGYIPTAAAYTEGGYEVTGAIRFYGTLMPAPESEELIVARAQEALAQLATS